MEFTNGLPSQTSTLARQDKALVKRNVYRPSLIPGTDKFIEEDNATNDCAQNKKVKNQPRGYAFWALVFALCVVAVCNFFLTVTIFSVLRLTKSMEAIEVLPAANLIKFFGELEMEKLIKPDGIINGFAETPVTFTTLGSDLKFKVLDELEPEISVRQYDVEFLNIDSFEMTEPGSGKQRAFSTTFPNFGLPNGVEKLDIKKATANRITSGLNQPLMMKSERTIRLKGNEGIDIRGREVLFKADQDLNLRSINGSIVLSGEDGVQLDIDSMSVSKEEEGKQRIAEYKLCICMPSGQLYRIPVLEGADVRCDSVDLSVSDDNPCI